MKADVIYFVESVPKELDVACIVREMAEWKYGLRIEIASYKAHAPDCLLSAKPKVLVIPTCYAAEAWGVRKHIGHWPTAAFLNLTWEQLFCRANLTWKHPRDPFAQRHVQHHIWGEFYREFLTSNGVPDEHIFVNGNPSYQLYAAPYRDYFPNRTELAAAHGLDPAKRWVLLPENYGWAFYSEANIAGRIQDGLDASIPSVMQDYCRRSLKSAMEWCLELAREPGVEVIVRPRPTTRLSQFEEVCRDLLGRPLTGIRFIKEGTVNEWILASDVVVSSFSTSLIEATLAGKPAYMLEPIPLPDPLWSIWYDEAESLVTCEEFLEACLKPGVPESHQRLLRWAHANLLSQGDPIENLVNYLGGVCDGSRKLPAPPAGGPLVSRPRRNAVKSLLRNSWNELQNLIASRRRPGDRHSMAFGQRDVHRKGKSWRRVLRAQLT